MSSGIPAQLPQPTWPLPPIPSTPQLMPVFMPNNETPTPSKYLSPSYDPIHHPSVLQSAFDPEASLRHVSPVSGAETSKSIPVTSVGSTAKRKGPPEVQWDASKDRKYARLYSLSDADIDDLPIIMRDDTLKFEKRIAQEKSSENLGPRPNELRPSPKEPKEMFERMKQSYISKKYLLGRSRGNVPNQPNFSSRLGETAPGDLEALECQLEAEFSTSTFSSSGTSSYQFLEALENFAQNIAEGPEKTATESWTERRIRTSYESLQSLRKRIDERKAKKGQKLRDYSYEELVKYIFIKRLSVGSLPSDRSTTSSLHSKRSSDASEVSTSASTRQSSTTLYSVRDDEESASSGFSSPPSALGYAFDHIQNTPPAKPLRHLFEARRPTSTAPKIYISEPAIQFTTNMAFSPSHDFIHRQAHGERDLLRPEVTNLERESTSDNNIDQAECMIKVEGFPHVGPRFQTLDGPDIPSHAEPGEHLRATDLNLFIRPDPTPATPTQLSRQMCCVNRCRGDPRADKCLFCLFDIPQAHFFVRSLVEKWHVGVDILTAFAARPVAIDFGEVDDFGDTALHLASSLGAGNLILCWLITMGVSIHAKNVAGQTFMHVYHPATFARSPNLDIFVAATSAREDMPMVLDTLQKLNFDFNARDDFGQTPMHVLTQYLLPVDTIELAVQAAMLGGSSLSNIDFLGRSIKSQIRAQAAVGDDKLFDNQRQVNIETLFHSAESLMAGINGHFTVPSASFVDNFLGEHVVLHPNASLRKIIMQAIFGFPDARYRGRNSLHCLAESCISLQLRRDETNTDSSSLKRKRRTDFALRHDYIVNTVKKLLEAGVDANDYDKDGNTPLMSFIRNNLSPKPERKITAEVLQALIDAGASVHRRNRRGETALHIAMRIGRPSAVEVLLNNYANVHTRAERGEGILAIASKASLRAKRDGALYHRIITCIAMAGKYGGILGPSTKDEWDRQRNCVNKEGPVMIESSRDGDGEIANVQ